MHPSQRTSLSCPTHRPWLQSWATSMRRRQSRVLSCCRSKGFPVCSLQNTTRGQRGSGGTASRMASRLSRRVRRASTTSLCVQRLASCRIWPCQAATSLKSTRCLASTTQAITSALLPASSISKGNTDRQTQTQTQTHRHTDTRTQTHRHTQRQTDRQTHTHTHTHTQRQGQRHLPFSSKQSCQSTM